MGGAFLIAVPFVIKWRRLSQQMHQVASQSHTFQKILDNAKEARCWWQDETQPVNPTYGLICLLGLNGDQPIYVRDILNQFSSEDAFKLKNLLNDLKKNQIAFSNLLTLMDEYTVLRVSGLNIVENGATIWVLSFFDVTFENTQIIEAEKEKKKLLQENHRLKLLLDIVPVAIWYRGEGNKIEFCNQVYAGILETLPHKVIQEGRELIDTKKKL